MYRVSPLTYIVDGVAATGLHGRIIKCSSSELNVFNPPSGQTCGAYMKAYLTQAPGQLLNPAATSQCQYCPLSNADQFLSVSAITWSTRWRNFGIVWVYISFNIFMAVTLYYCFRVRKWGGRKPGKRFTQVKNVCVVLGIYARAIFAMWWGQAQDPF
jgi:ATP-binding cassette subfamily G (WHITE) protein 2 (PDR)